MPIIYFVNGCAPYLDDYASSGADVLGVDWRVGIDEVRRRVGDGVALQGNLDPGALFASPAEIRTRVADILARAGAIGHIFNLGHGVLPETDPEHVRAMVDRGARAVGAPLSSLRLRASASVPPTHEPRLRPCVQRGALSRVELIVAALAMLRLVAGDHRSRPVVAAAQVFEHAVPVLAGSRVEHADVGEVFGVVVTVDPVARLLHACGDRRVLRRHGPRRS